MYSKGMYYNKNPPYLLLAHLCSYLHWTAEQVFDQFMPTGAPSDHERVAALARKAVVCTLGVSPEQEGRVSRWVCLRGKKKHVAGENIVR